MLSAIGLFCNTAVVNVFFSTTAPIVYSCLVAQPSSGKSKALTLVNGAITAVEKHLGLTHLQSKQVNPPTTAALIGLLNDLHTVIGIFTISFSIYYRIYHKSIRFKLHTMNHLLFLLLWDAMAVVQMEKLMTNHFI
jgi:hypothetical protein